MNEIVVEVVVVHLNQDGNDPEVINQQKLQLNAMEGDL